jgi:hypothetical protein
VPTIVTTRPPGPLDEPVELRVRETVEEAAGKINSLARRKGLFAVLTGEDGKEFTIHVSLVANIREE